MAPRSLADSVHSNQATYQKTIWANYTDFSVLMLGLKHKIFKLSFVIGYYQLYSHLFIFDTQPNKLIPQNKLLKLAVTTGVSWVKNCQNLHEEHLLIASFFETVCFHWVSFLSSDTQGESILSKF